MVKSVKGVDTELLLVEEGEFRNPQGILVKATKDLRIYIFIN